MAETAEATGGCVWGIDLGTSQGMSAVSAYYPETGHLDALAVFPCEPSLDKRGRKDGVGDLYEQMRQRGELHTAGARVSDIKALLKLALTRFGEPVAVVCDRWRQAELGQVMDGLNPNIEFVSRGQGYKDGAEDVRAFRKALLTGHVHPSPSLLLTSAMAEATTVSDPAGNEKLAKGAEGGRRSLARDDAVAAAILAVSLGSRRYEHNETGVPLSFAVV